MKKLLLSSLFILSIIGVGFAQSQKYAYVDLGLPSGLLWATCNIGADAPEEDGTYFAWGETNSKASFTWENYKHGKTKWLKGTMFTKYCSWPDKAYKKKTDRRTVLEKVDDAAADNWGNGWRMPTKMEWKELLDNTTQVLTTVNGTKGYRFTARNGNSIFIPLAGHRINEHRYASEGYYWSSSLGPDDPAGAYCLVLNQKEVQISIRYRRIGYTVRPVHNAI